MHTTTLTRRGRAAMALAVAGFMALGAWTGQARATTLQATCHSATLYVGATSKATDGKRVWQLEQVGGGHLATGRSKGTITVPISLVGQGPYIVRLTTGSYDKPEALSTSPEHRREVGITGPCAEGPTPTPVPEVPEVVPPGTPIIPVPPAVITLPPPVAPPTAPPSKPRPPVRMSIDKVASKRVAQLGARVVFKLRVKNEGRRSTGPVVLRDLLPAGLALVRAPGATVQGNVLTWRFAGIPVGGQRVRTVVTRVLRNGPEVLRCNRAFAQAGPVQRRARVCLRVLLPPPPITVSVLG